jgi:hypothetical protein
MSVQSGEQEVGPLSVYGQLQGDSLCGARAPVEVRSLGYAEWAVDEPITHQLRACARPTSVWVARPSGTMF